MIRLWRRIEAFLFEPVSATTFGVMRAAWAFGAAFPLLLKAPDIVRYYSDAGILPRSLVPLMMREEYRYTVFSLSGDPRFVIAVYLVFLVAAFCLMIGWKPRLSMLVTYVLFCSFNERNTMLVAGGETILRTTGFILLVAPGIQAFSVERLKKQWKQWRQTRSLLPAMQMPMWPKRLLLWQLFLIYILTWWSKLLGEMWHDGTAPAVVLMSSIFRRYDGVIMEFVAGFSPIAAYAILLYEPLWFLMLVPRKWWENIPLLRGGRVRRLILAGGFLFHFSIWLFIRVGAFLFAETAAYFGMLMEEDTEWLKRKLNRKWSGKISVLYDGDCGLCQRSVFSLRILDWLNRLEPRDFRNPADRRASVPELTLQELDKSMHIRMPDGRMEKGFRAFREIARHLPLTWLIAPLLSLPFVEPVGEKVYAGIAARRAKCTHESCSL